MLTEEKKKAREDATQKRKAETEKRRKDRNDERGGRYQSLIKYDRFKKGIPEITQESSPDHSTWKRFRNTIARDTFLGSLLYNLVSFLLPALHSTLSTLLVGKINTKEISTNHFYTYIMAMGLILNDGLPQGAWTVIGDQTTRKLTSRVSLTYTLILFQVIVGLLICGFGMTNARASVIDTPDDLRNASLVYVRLTYMSIISSVVEVSVSNCARALDHPEIPLLINTIKFTLNMIMDATIMSQARTGLHRPSMNNRAAIRLASDLASALIGIAFFYRFTLQRKLKLAEEEEKSRARPCSASLIILWQHGIWTLVESTIRNVFNSWLINGFESGMGPDDVLAWTTFTAIRGRGSILMVPLQALEASTLTYVGHAWGEWRSEELQKEDQTPDTAKLHNITRPAWLPIILAPLIEIPVYITLSIWWARSFASYLSGSVTVTAMVQWMWRTIDWCYIFSPITILLGAILIGTVPRFFLLQGSITSVFWIMPWAIALPGENLTPDSAWRLLATILSIEQILGLLGALFSVWLWRKLLMKEKVKLLPVTEDVDEKAGGTSSSPYEDPPGRQPDSPRYSNNGCNGFELTPTNGGQSPAETEGTHSFVDIDLNNLERRENTPRRRNEAGFPADRDSFKGIHSSETRSGAADGINYVETELHSSIEGDSIPEPPVTEADEGILSKNRDSPYCRTYTNLDMPGGKPPSSGDTGRAAGASTTDLDRPDEDSPSESDDSTSNGTAKANRSRGDSTNSNRRHPVDNPATHANDFGEGGGSSTGGSNTGSTVDANDSDPDDIPATTGGNPGWGAQGGGGGGGGVW